MVVATLAARAYWRDRELRVLLVVIGVLGVTVVILAARFGFPDLGPSVTARGSNEGLAFVRP